MKTVRKPPATGELHVWRVELAGDDPRRRARDALATILAEYLADPGEAAPDSTAVELSADENGKPRLAAAPGRLSFNLSHSGGLALVALAPGGVEVGVDVERRKPRRDLVRLAERWLPDDDATAVATASVAEREGSFYAAWTRHEARVKCVGTGLAGPPPPAEIIAWPLEIDDGYAAAVAVDITNTGVGGRRPGIRLRTWDG
jgi:4'-phosphopantetheinyl transferase